MADRTILCFGDSNTHGTRAMRFIGDRRRFDQALRWPSIMGAILGPEYEVITEGHPARTAVFDDPVEGEHKNGMRSIQMLLESHRPIDLVIVMLGTNDIKPRFSASPIDIAHGLERLLKVIKSSEAGADGGGPKILLVAPVPVEESGVLAPIFEGSPAKSRALAPAFEAVAKRQKTGFVDLAPVASVDMVDGVHLSTESLEAIGHAIAQEVERVLNAR